MCVDGACFGGKDDALVESTREDSILVHTAVVTDPGGAAQARGKCELSPSSGFHLSGPQLEDGGLRRGLEVILAHRCGGALRAHSPHDAGAPAALLPWPRETPAPLFCLSLGPGRSPSHVAHV